MKYLVKIDRNSIKPNPWYPHAYGYETYPRELRKTIEYVGRDTKNGVEWTQISETISIPESNIQYIDCLGTAPRYHYSYEKTLVECYHCNQVFSHEDLQYDDTEYSENYTNKMCPKCGCWDCCELEFEKLSQEELEGIYKSRDLS